MAADSPPSDMTQAGRIWPKLLASHWASTPSNDSVYETHCCANQEFWSTCQDTAGNSSQVQPTAITQLARTRVKYALLSNVMS